MQNQTMDDFKYESEQFADIQILRYQVPGFTYLSLKQKELAFYLYQAALSGRDIFYDQNYKYNLIIRRTCEAIMNSYPGHRNTRDWENFIVYTKRVWFSNGIHHHYSTKKILPNFNIEYFEYLISNTDQKFLPLEKDQTVKELFDFLCPIIFDPKVDSQKVVLNPEVDMIKSSATNFYENVSQNEVEEFYKKKFDNKDNQPVSHGLNSKLLKEKEEFIERRWKDGEMYSAAIEKIIYWLEKAVKVSENEIQKQAFNKLIEFYKTGDLKKWDDYNIIWIQDIESTVDTVNGFIEVYNDPLGYRGSFESVVSIKDYEATKRIKTISDNAGWFEDHSPIENRHKKKNVVGILAKAISVVVESGDASPSTPIGINLPNARWMRMEYGSKSVNLSNIVHAYDKAASKEALMEFSYSQEEVERANTYGSLADNLEAHHHSHK